MKKYLIDSIYIFIAISLISCGGGECSSTPPDITTPPFTNYTFSNGSTLTGDGNLQVAAGVESSVTFSLSGGTAPFAVQLSTITAQNLRQRFYSWNATESLSGTFEPDTLAITTINNESSSNLNITVTNNLAVGTYYLKLYANPINGSSLASIYYGY